MKRKVTSALRFKILKRDGFKCQYCGASAAEAELHVDHVDAVSLGGTNAERNLKTACRQCNLSKHAKAWQWEPCEDISELDLARYLVTPLEFAERYLWTAWSSVARERHGEDWVGHIRLPDQSIADEYGQFLAIFGDAGSGSQRCAGHLWQRDPERPVPCSPWGAGSLSFGGDSDRCAA